MRFFFLSIIAFTIASCAEDSSQPFEKKSNRLPFIGHADVIEIEEDGIKKKDTLFETIAYFDFLNEDSVLVTNKTYENKVWVAEFFFASCPTICPIMNVQMSRLYDWLKEKEYLAYFQLLSFSIDPNNDTPHVLQKHKNSYCEDCENWSFLTGDENKTHRLGIESFRIFAGKDEEAAGGYAHSGAFSLVDKRQRVRGVYNITDANGDLNKKEYQRLKQDIDKLMRYEYHFKKR